MLPVSATQCNGQERACCMTPNFSSASHALIPPRIASPTVFSVRVRGHRRSPHGVCVTQFAFGAVSRMIGARDGNKMHEGVRTMGRSTIEHGGGPISINTIDARNPWVADETIIFHHGLGACGAVFHGWMQVLAEDYRLVTFDMRGHGGTPVPDGYEWSLDGMIDDLEAVAAGVGAERFHLVGESIGGTVALAYATRRPERLLSLTISNGTHIGGSIENLAPWKSIIATGGMTAWSEHMMGQRFHPGALTGEQFAWYQAQQATPDPEALLTAAGMLAGADLTPELHKATVPTLLLHPDDSPFIPVPVMVDLYQKLPAARLQVFAHARHGLPFSHAKACGRNLRRFLSDVRS
jgi:pimeloyl-ACP methyl ester carboxylesterase